MQNLPRKKVEFSALARQGMPVMFTKDGLRTMPRNKGNRSPLSQAERVEIVEALRVTPIARRVAQQTGRSRRTVGKIAKEAGIALTHNSQQPLSPAAERFWEMVDGITAAGREVSSRYGNDSPQMQEYVATLGELVEQVRDINDRASRAKQQASALKTSPSMPQ